jgi:hypothetical protein
MMSKCLLMYEPLTAADHITACNSIPVDRRACKRYRRHRYED